MSMSVCVFACVLYASVAACRFDAWMGRGEEAGMEKARENEGRRKCCTSESGSMR